MSDNVRSSPVHLKVCSRMSPLALAQTNHVIAALCAAHPGLTCEIQKLETHGDKVLDKPLPKIGDKGLFTQELERCLLDGTADIAVHSLKDVQTTLPDGLTVGAILKRENPCDVAVFRDPSAYRSVKDLPEGAVVGTSSLRRKATLQNMYPKLRFADVRGNVNTRLAKLRDPETKKYDAIILAHAGLARLNMEAEIHEVLDAEEYFYAVGQAALAVECRSGDTATLELLKAIHHNDTAMLVGAERSMLRTLEGGCHVPISVHSTLVAGEPAMLRLRTIVYSEEGAVLGRADVTGPAETFDSIGVESAQQCKGDSP
eukprot:PhM_4_TR8602/c0_g1_i1/m.29205/K01749/hemC, HMBS; hydroxymethylbilane synthase